MKAICGTSVEIEENKLHNTMSSVGWRRIDGRKLCGPKTMVGTKELKASIIQLPKKYLSASINKWSNWST